MLKYYRSAKATATVRPGYILCSFRDLLYSHQIVAANGLPLELTGSPRRHI